MLRVGPLLPCLAYSLYHQVSPFSTLFSKRKAEPSVVEDSTLGYLTM